MTFFNPFQWLVDTTQKPAPWCCQQMVLLMAVCAMLCAVAQPSLSSQGSVVAVLMALHCGVGWVMTRNAALLFEVGESVWPLTIFLFVAWCGVVVALSVADANQGWALPAKLYGFAVCGFMAFAACKPPAPPKKNGCFVRQAPRPKSFL